MNTKDYRIAPGGEGELAATWADKPHRLVYDLCEHIERGGSNDWFTDRPTVPGYYWHHVNGQTKMFRAVHASNSMVYVSEIGGIVENPTGHFKRVATPENPA